MLMMNGTKTVGNQWLFEGKVFDEDLKHGYQGFVYKITNHKTNRKYIGRKYFWSVRKVKGKTKRQRSESNWKDYWSSSKVVQEDVKNLGEEHFSREILVLCHTRGDINRMETYYLWKNNVLENDEWYNDSVGNMKSAPKHIIEKRKYARWNKPHE